METYKDVCSACEILRKTSANFVENAVTDSICANLKANTGLNGKSNNCTDLHNINDCLIGGMIEDTLTYNECNSLDALRDALKNIMAEFDALICSDCGQWDEIAKLWKEIQKLWNAINALEKRVKALEDAKGANDQTIKNMNDALQKIINNLQNSGAWSGGMTGNFNNGRSIATGNINLFGGTADGNSFIRTNKGKTENDVFAGGV